MQEKQDRMDKTDKERFIKIENMTNEMDELKGRIK